MAVNCKVSNDHGVIACSSGIRKHTPKNPGHPLIRALAHLPEQPARSTNRAVRTR